MCIRDRQPLVESVEGAIRRPLQAEGGQEIRLRFDDHSHRCLLYTSDAADERSSVDLGGRRIIKKKNTIQRKTRHIIVTVIVNNVTDVQLVHQRINKNSRNRHSV